MRDLVKKQGREVAKPLLYAGMASIFIFFAGLTSGYLVRMAGGDWQRIPFPPQLFVSTLLILLSSVSLQLAYACLKRGSHTRSAGYATAALLLGLGFMYAQFLGFAQLIRDGIYFTGARSNIAGSFMYVLVVAHLAHVLGGVIASTCITVKTWWHKYGRGNTLGFQLGLLFWHFLTGLWVFLCLFLYFVR
ncbi:MAG: cytochrome c oxidase subunit 3 [Flavobacteriales bacterium]